MNEKLITEKDNIVSDKLKIEEQLHNKNQSINDLKLLHRYEQKKLNETLYEDNITLDKKKTKRNIFILAISIILIVCYIIIEVRAY